MSAIEAKVDLEEGFDGVGEINERQDNEPDDNNRKNGDATARLV